MAASVAWTEAGKAQLAEERYRHDDLRELTAH
jgi:hypothetical protein